MYFVLISDNKGTFKKMNINLLRPTDINFNFYHVPFIGHNLTVPEVESNALHLIVVAVNE